MNYSNTSRRDFLTSTFLAGAGFMVETEAASVAQSAKQGEFWPNGARLAVSFSLMFEAGGQPISGAGGPVTEPIQNGAPDLPTNSFFEYGFTEGIPLTRQRSLFYLTTGNAVALSEDSYGNV
jgi:hypothetical protein